MSDPLADWWRHQITLRRWTGEGSDGPTFAAAETPKAAIGGETKLVRNALNAEVVSTVQIALPASVGFVPPQSEIDLPAAFGGRTTRVLSTAVGDGGGQPTPDHIELYCQ